MSAPDGEFVIVILCKDCQRELNRSKPITRKEYTEAVMSGPLCTKPCPNGCRSTYSDMNMNTVHRWERLDGSVIEQERPR